MKKVNMLLGLLSAAAIVFACAKEENPGANDGTQDDTQKDEVVTPGEDDEDQTGGEADENAMAYFFATTEGADVKVSIGQDGTTALEDGDVAVVYVPATGASCNYVYSASAGRFAAAEGSTAVTLDGNEAWVCYPADYFTVSQEEAGVALSIPASVATAGGYKSPMAGKLVSGTEGQEVELKNIGSILRVNLTSAFPQAPETVTAVRLNSNAGICAAALSFENELPALSEVSGETSVTVELGEAGIVLSETAATVHFFVPAEIEASLSVDVCYGKDGWEAAPYTRVERKSALTAVRAELYDIDFAAGLFSGGDGSEANPYLIASAEDFKALATAVNSTDAKYGATSAGTFFGSAGAHYQQTADIDFADGESKGDISDYMIGSSSAPFKGSYNGKDGETQHTISNFAITGTDNTGLFGYCAGAVISNVKVAGASVTGVQNIACIIGYANKGTVSGCETTDDCSVVATDANVAGISGNCYGGAEFNACINRASVTVEGTAGNNFGGIVGYTDNGKLVGCYNYGTISGTGQVGGISGRMANGSITDCVNEGTVSGTGANVGGIVCTLTAGTVSGCTNSGAVTGGANAVGGIIGNMTIGYVEDCVNSGDISGNETSSMYVGGIAGTMGLSAGSTSKLYIKACISDGDISAYKGVGAIAGGVRAGIVYECYAKGTVTGTEWVGGLAGVAYSDVNRISIFDSLVKSAVSATTNSGGVVGTIRGISSNYIWVTNCVGDNVSLNMTGSNVGSVVGYMYSSGGTASNYRVWNNFTLADTSCDYVGKYSAGSLKNGYYVNGPAATSATGTNIVKKSLSEITAELMDDNVTVGMSLIKNNTTWVFNASTWTTVQGVAYPLPSGLVAHGEEYYK